MNRDFDGIYFRVFRCGKWTDVCFSDLTESEQREVLVRYNTKQLTNMCIKLARVIREIGDQFDIRRGFS